MSYFVADAKGYIGDLASGGGLATLMAWMGEQLVPEIRQFMQWGYTLKPMETALALRAAAGARRTEACESARLLATLLSRCDEIGIITDGVGDDSAEGYKAVKPLPMPSGGQGEDDWIEACMAHPTMVREFPDEDRRLAVCHSQWERHG